MNFNTNSLSARVARRDYKMRQRAKFRRDGRKQFPNSNIAAVESGRSAVENEASPSSASLRAAADAADTNKHTTHAGQQL